VKTNENLDCDEMLNVAREQAPGDDHHRQLKHRDREKMKDHDACQDQMNTKENTMDMDQQKIEYRFQLTRKLFSNKKRKRKVNLLLNPLVLYVYKRNTIDRCLFIVSRRITYRYLAARTAIACAIS